MRWRCAVEDFPFKTTDELANLQQILGQARALDVVQFGISIRRHDVCAAGGLTGEQGVLIPQSNVKHLMLRVDVVEAVAAGKFHVHAIETVDDAMEVLTGLPAGTANEAGEYPAGSVNHAVAVRFEELFQIRQSLSSGGNEEAKQREP